MRQASMHAETAALTHHQLCCAGKFVAHYLKLSVEALCCASQLKGSTLCFEIERHMQPAANAAQVLLDAAALLV